MPLSAFGDIDPVSLVPRKLAELAPILVANLDDEWDTHIFDCLNNMDIPAKPMITILKSAPDDFMSCTMMWAFVWFFRIDHYCYRQANFESRIVARLDIDQPSKTSASH